MKKILRLSLIIAALTALLCIAFAFAACDTDSGTLRVENAKISFMCGDKFERGKDFAVYLDYKDGRSQDVTSAVEVRQENGMDMNVAGNYQITVVYGDKRTIYTVYVNDSEDILRKIELDTETVNKNYKLGDAVSFRGLGLNLTYENAQGILFSEYTLSLSGFNVSVTDKDGAVINDVFTSLGTFTVTVSKNSVQASYEVTVDGVNVSTVQGALTVGKYFAGKAASGTVLTEGSLTKGETFTASVYEYGFGDNYTFFKETHTDPTMEYHCGTDENGFFVAYLENGVIKTSNRNNAAMMNGAPILLWYSYETVYGVENALNNLYSHALSSSNADLKETVDESTRTYSFSFSGLEYRDRDSDYYETTVTFTLGEDFSVSYVKFTQDYYEYNGALADQEGYVPTFITDPATGKTVPNGDYSARTIVTVTQVSGERTAENKYNRNMFNLSSYKLMYDGEELEDGAVIKLNSGNTYKLQISDVLPVTADLSVDIMTFDYVGNLVAGDFWLSNEDFALTRSGKEITLSAKRGGTHTLIFRTADTERTLTIEVTGDVPQNMSAKLYNASSQTFYDGNDKTVSVAGEAFFYGQVDNYANSEQKATVTSDNAEFATITETSVNVKVGTSSFENVKCWKFTATQAGTYQVTVVSSVSSFVSCIFTFTVSDAVDYVDLLSGTYTAQDRVGDIYRLTFSMTDADELRGNVTVTRTPTDANDNPLTDQAVERVLQFYVSGTDIVLTGNLGDGLWLQLDVNEDGKLILVDQRYNEYELIRV